MCSVKEVQQNGISEEVELPLRNGTKCRIEVASIRKNLQKILKCSFSSKNSRPADRTGYYQTMNYEYKVSANCQGIKNNMKICQIY